MKHTKHYRTKNVFAGMKLRPEIQAMMNRSILEKSLKKNTPPPSVRKVIFLFNL